MFGGLYDVFCASEMTARSSWKLLPRFLGENVGSALGTRVKVGDDDGTGVGIVPFNVTVGSKVGAVVRFVDVGPKESVGAGLIVGCSLMSSPSMSSITVSSSSYK